MLENSGAKTVLSERVTAGRLQAQNITVLLLDDETVFDGSSDAIRLRRDAGRCLYVIYTWLDCKPKGVAIHIAAREPVAWHREAFAVSPADRAGQVASLAFDACGWELWPYLAAGASVTSLPTTWASPSDLLKALIENESRSVSCRRRWRKWCSIIRQTSGPNCAICWSAATSSRARRRAAISLP